jgi:lysozyme
MKTSKKVIVLIKSFEGCRLSTYKCSAGVLTIGYGHTGSDVKDGMKITQAQADEFLKKDLEKFEKGVFSLVTVALTQSQFDALVAFSFNVGLGALKKSTLLRHLNQGAALEASNQFLVWDKVAGKPLAGLTRRRTAERELFLSEGL